MREITLDNIDTISNKNYYTTHIKGSFYYFTVRVDKLESYPNLNYVFSDGIGLLSQNKHSLFRIIKDRLKGIDGHTPSKVYEFDTQIEMFKAIVNKDF